MVVTVGGDTLPAIIGPALEHRESDCRHEADQFGHHNCC